MVCKIFLIINIPVYLVFPFDHLEINTSKDKIIRGITEKFPTNICFNRIITFVVCIHFWRFVYTCIKKKKIKKQRLQKLSNFAGKTNQSSKHLTIFVIQRCVKTTTFQQTKWPLILRFKEKIASLETF